MPDNFNNNFWKFCDNQFHISRIVSLTLTYSIEGIVDSMLPSGTNYIFLYTIIFGCFFKEKPLWERNHVCPGHSRTVEENFEETRSRIYEKRNYIRSMWHQLATKADYLSLSDHLFLYGEFVFWSMLYHKVIPKLIVIETSYSSMISVSENVWYNIVYQLRHGETNWFCLKILHWIPDHKSVWFTTVKAEC